MPGGGDGRSSPLTRNACQASRVEPRRRTVRRRSGRRRRRCFDQPQSGESADDRYVQQVLHAGGVRAPDSRRRTSPCAEPGRLEPEVAAPVTGRCAHASLGEFLRADLDCGGRRKRGLPGEEYEHLRGAFDSAWPIRLTAASRRPSASPVGSSGARAAGGRSRPQPGDAGGGAANRRRPCGHRREQARRRAPARLRLRDRRGRHGVLPLPAPAPRRGAARGRRSYRGAAVDRPHSDQVHPESARDRSWRPVVNPEEPRRAGRDAEPGLRPTMDRQHGCSRSRRRGQLDRTRQRMPSTVLPGTESRSWSGAGCCNGSRAAPSVAC